MSKENKDWRVPEKGLIIIDEENPGVKLSIKEFMAKSKQRVEELKYRVKERTDYIQRHQY